MQLLWLLAELIRMNIPESDTLVALLLRHVMSGDVSARNLLLLQQLLSLLAEQRYKTISRLHTRANSPQCARGVYDTLDRCGVTSRSMLQTLAHRTSRFDTHGGVHLPAARTGPH